MKVDLKCHHLILSNEIVASGEIKIESNIANKGKYHQSLPLYKNERLIGEIEINCQFRDPN